MTEKIIDIKASLIDSTVNNVEHTTSVSINNTVANVIQNNSYTTKVDDLSLNVQVTNMGEGSIPNEQYFKRLDTFANNSDLISLSNSKRINDAISKLDLFNRIVSFRRLINETKTITDQTRKDLSKIFNDTNQTSSLLKTKVFKVFEDTSETSDINAKIFNKNLVESFLKTDIAKLGIDKVFNELSDFQDIVTLQITFRRVFSDVVDATDDFYGTANLDDDQIATVIKRVISYADTIDTHKLDFNKKLDTTYISSEESYKQLNKRLADSYATSDIFITNLGKVNYSELYNDDTNFFSINKFLLSETYLVNEYTFNLNKGIEILFSNTDPISLNTSKILNSNFSNTDAIITEWDALRVFNNQFSTSTSIPLFNTFKGIEDNSITSDQSSLYSYKVLLDEYSYTDTLYLVVDYNRSFSDTVYSTDDFYGSANIDDDQIATVNKVLQELTLVNDKESFEIYTSNLSSFSKNDIAALSPNKVLGSSFGTADVLTFRKYIDRYLEELNLVSDSGFINNQNYFSSNYVSPGYAGTNTYFN